MGNKFRHITPNLSVRPIGNGQIEGQYQEEVGRALKAKRELRKETDGQGVVQKDTGLRLTSSYPKSVEMQMHEDMPETQHNQNARDWWLREHAPENLIADPRNIPGLKPRRKFFRIDWEPKR